jgi:hypothetical protein
LSLLPLLQAVMHFKGPNDNVRADSKTMDDDITIHHHSSSSPITEPAKHRLDLLVQI